MGASSGNESSAPIVRILGPVDVVDTAGRVWVPGTSMRRTLLTLLALEAGRVVEAERLLDMAWNGDPPSSGLSSLRFHVSKLRQDLPADLIETVPGGYQLHATTDVRLVEQGVAGLELLSHWRGEPMIGASPCAVLDRERERLGELRLRVAEQAFSKSIDDGEASTVIPELRQLCLEHPLRESLWARLITAEYQVGNQAEALRSLGVLRAKLVDELGVDPSPELQRLEVRILQHDPDLGEHGSRDSSDPERHRQAPVSGRATQVPPLRSLESGRGNLPIPTSSFVGRQQELDELEGLIERARLLVLVGVGGVGKTRLGLELAARVKPRFEGGVWVVDLWQIDDPEQVEDAIIGTLGLHYGQGRSPREILVDALGFSPVLIVLDTCEHIVDAVADLAEFLIGRCPQLTLVATSREVLASPSAISRSVDSLDDAVALFVARAQATRGGFDLNSENEAAVERICEQLDGIPLAIELVAARSATLDPRTIEARLDDVFTMVRSSGQGRAERHRTLEATIAWSYELLEPAEQLVFRRLSVFLGGFTLSAAEHVCSGDGRCRAPRCGGSARTPGRQVHGHDDRRPLDRPPFSTPRHHPGVQPGPTRRGRRCCRVEATSRHLLRSVGGRGLADRVGSRRRHGFAARSLPKSQPEVGHRMVISVGDLDRALALAPLGRLLAQAERYDAAQWLAPVLELAGIDEHPTFVAAVGERSLYQLIRSG